MDAGSGGEMNCKQVAQKLAAFMDGQLNPLLMRDIVDHLENCGECQRQLDRFEAVWNLLDAVRVPPPPTDFPEAIMRNIAATGRVLGRGESVPRRFSLFHLMAAAAAIAGAVAGFFVGSMLGGSPASAKSEFAVAALEEILSIDLSEVSVEMVLTEVVDNGSKEGEP